MASGLVKMKCVIAIDSGNECIQEIVYAMLPAEWHSDVTVATYAQLTDVIEMVRNVLPAVLVIHTNLLLLDPEVGIAGCAAVSPDTRYLVLTAWSEEQIDNLLRFYELPHISLGALRMPFDKAQLIAALEAACGFRRQEDSNPPSIQSL
jgi:hypothetical protein